MPLPPAAPREHLHTRQIECLGFRREDGFWEIEARLVDTKSYGFHSEARGDVVADQPVHDMSIRLTIDENLMIHDAVGCMDHTPYSICGDATLEIGKLKGLRIGLGWTRRAHKVMGGRRGCTHLFELLRPVATTCFQTMSGSRFREDEVRGTTARPGGKRPYFINGCHALASNGEIVREQWPQYYDGDEASAPR